MGVPQVVIAGAAFCFSPAPAYTQNPAAENDKNMVQGTVVNAVTHAPIGRALVHSADERLATFTNSEGHFELTLSPMQPDRVNSQIWLKARKPGFVEDPTRSSLVPARAGKELTIELTPEGLIEGRVEISAADPALGVSLQLFRRDVQEGRFRWIQAGTARTNSSGEFRFADLRRGAYKLFSQEWLDRDPENSQPGQEYGYPPAYYLGADFATAGTIELMPGETVHADLKLARQAYYPVSIPVVAGEPPRGVSVTVSLQGHGGPGYSLGYVQGTQKISGSLPNGKYLVEASTFGEQSASGWVNLTVAGSPAEGPTMVLAGNNSIPVNVREAFTSQPENSTVISRGRSARRVRSYLNYLLAEPAEDFARRGGASLREPAEPNDDSLYLDKIAPGRYWLRMSASRGYIAAASMGGTDLLREPLVVVPGASTPIEITLRDDFAELDGTVLGVSSSAATGTNEAAQQTVYVYCAPLPESGGQLQEVGVSGDHKFEVSDLPPGTYRVMAFSTPQRNIPYLEVEAMRAYETKGQVVRLSPGQKASVQLELSAGEE